MSLILQFFILLLSPLLHPLCQSYTREAHSQRSSCRNKMERTQEQWRNWFRCCMMLSGRGFIPGNPKTRTICGRSEMEAYWGPAVEFTEGIGAPCRGYEFRDEDGERYHLYVTELFERVHQRKLQRRILPYHFARGLAVEASGRPVNWTAFAMSRCFPRHKKSPFAPLPEYAGVSAPVPWVHKRVLPVLEDAGGGEIANQVQVLLSYLNRHLLPT